MGLDGIVDEVLLTEGFFQILLNVTKVSVQNFCNVIELATDTARQLCLLSSEGVGCILHIGSGALKQPYVDCLLVPEFLNLCKGGFLSLL